MSREIILYSGLDKTFPPCDLRLVTNVERTEFRVCLGTALYEQLLSVLVDYSLTPAYVVSSTYALNDLVTYEGLVYKAKGAVPANQPPPTLTYWELAPKFSDPCAQSMWCDYLAEYLSLSVVIAHIPRLHAQVAAEGVVQRVGSTYQPASDKAYGSLYANLLALREASLENLLAYGRTVVKDKEHECYDLYALLKPLEVSCCGGCGELSDYCSCDEGCKSASVSYLVG